MPVSIHEEKIPVRNKREALKYFFIIRCYKEGKNLSMNDIETLVELYLEGYTDQFFNNCIEKGFFDSKQTVLNSVGKMAKQDILWSEKRGERFISDNFLPSLSEDKVLLNYKIANL